MSTPAIHGRINGFFSAIDWRTSPTLCLLVDRPKYQGQGEFYPSDHVCKPSVGFSGPFTLSDPPGWDGLINRDVTLEWTPEVTPSQGMVIKFFIGAQQVMSLSTGLDDDTDLLGVIGSIKWMPLKKKTPKQKESSPDQENPTQVVSQQ